MIQIPEEKKPIEVAVIMIVERQDAIVSLHINSQYQKFCKKLTNDPRQHKEFDQIISHNSDAIKSCYHYIEFLKEMIKAEEVLHGEPETPKSPLLTK